MALNIQITGSRELLDKFTGLPRKTREVLEIEIEEIAELLRKKVAENLSGKILPVKDPESGLLSTIKKEVFVSAYEFIAFVGPVPATPKAYALEYGGKGSFLIPLGPKGILANLEEDFFSRHPVIHPPSKEYAYLREALDEVRNEIPSHLEASFREMLL